MEVKLNFKLASLQARAPNTSNGCSEIDSYLESGFHSLSQALTSLYWSYQHPLQSAHDNPEQRLRQTYWEENWGSLGRLHIPELGRAAEHLWRESMRTYFLAGSCTTLTNQQLFGRLLNHLLVYACWERTQIQPTLQRTAAPNANFVHCFIADAAEWSEDNETRQDDDDIAAQARGHVALWRLRCAWRV